MTRKEKLLVEIYNLRNQIAVVKGDNQENIDELVQSYKFRDEAAGWKEYELKLRIEELKKSLEKAKVEAAQQAAADAFSRLFLSSSMRSLSSYSFQSAASSRNL